MTDNRSDEEIAAEERRRWRLSSRAVVGSVLFWMFLGFVMVLIFNSGFPERVTKLAGIPDVVLAWLPLALLLTIWLLLQRRLKRFMPSPATLRPGVQRRLVDDLARRQRWTMAVLALASLLLAIRLPNQTNIEDKLFYTAIYLIFILLAGLSVVFGPGFLSSRFRMANDDEASKHLRSRACGIGYLCATVAIGADYLVYLLTPDNLGMALPYSMASVIIVPAIYYIIADWWAEREN